MTDELTSRLGRQLHDQVDDWTPTPLTLEGVQGRARSIHRRRQAVAGSAIAAAVLAVAIPVGIGLGGSTDSSPGPTDDPTRVVDTPAPTPRADGTFPLTLDVDTGPVPVTGYLELAERTLHTSEGVLSLPAPFSQLERFGDGWIGVATRTNPENTGYDVVRLDADLQPVDEAPTTGLVVDEAGQRAAWVEVADGTGTLVVADPSDELGRTPVGPQSQPVGFLTDGSVVFQTINLESGESTFAVLTDTGVTPFGEGLLRLEAVSEATGTIAALSTYRSFPTRACSTVLDPVSGTEAFETCDFEPRAFSPDGTLLAAELADSDGIGSPELAILDAATGEPVVQWRSGRTPASALVQDMAWEDADTLLVTVTEGTRQSVLRATLDGRLTRVAEPRRVQMSIAYRLAGAIAGLG